MTYDEGREFAQKRGIKFFETSAKNKLNLDEAFLTIVEEMILRI